MSTDLSLQPPDSKSQRQGLDRRDFLKTATLTTVVAGMVSPVLAASGGITTSPSSASPVTAAPEESGGGKGAVPLAPPDKQPPDLRVPEPEPRKIGWAIVGLGELALEEILPAFLECKKSKPVALVSGHPEKARKVAEVYGIDPQAIYSYETFDELAKNDKVEVIYIVLPNSLHAEFTIRGLQAGKHVLCEKPMAPNIAECEKMIAAARTAGRQLGVAYRLHHEPNNLKVMEFCQKKTYGKVKLFTSNFCQTTHAPNIRLSKELAGGPVSDLGVYSINAARYTIGEEPVEVTAFAQQPEDNPVFREVPESVAYTMRFPSGAMAICQCSFNTAGDVFYHVVCEKGVIKMSPSFSYQGLKLSVSSGGQDCEFKIPPVNQFTEEIDNFSDAILKNQPNRTPGEEGLADMRVVVAINEAIRSGERVKVG